MTQEKLDNLRKLLKEAFETLDKQNIWGKASIKMEETYNYLYNKEICDSLRKDNLPV